MAPHKVSNLPQIVTTPQVFEQPTAAATERRTHAPDSSQHPLSISTSSITISSKASTQVQDGRSRANYNDPPSRIEEEGLTSRSLVQSTPSNRGHQVQMSSPQTPIATSHPVQVERSDRYQQRLDVVSRTTKAAEDRSPSRGTDTIRAPAHGSVSDQGPFKDISSFQPKTETAPISPPLHVSSNQNLNLERGRTRDRIEDVKDLKREDVGRSLIPSNLQDSRKIQSTSITLKDTEKDSGRVDVQLRSTTTISGQRTPDAPRKENGLTVISKDQHQAPSSPKLSDVHSLKDADKDASKALHVAQGHLGTNLSRVVSVLAKKETEASKPIKKVFNER